MPPNTAFISKSAGYSGLSMVIPPVRKPMASLPWVTSIRSSTVCVSPASAITVQPGFSRFSPPGRAAKAFRMAFSARSGSALPQ